MAKRVIAAAAESHAAPRISVNAKMKMLHALLVAVAKAVGMRIKNECKNSGFGPWVVLVKKNVSCVFASVLGHTYDITHCSSGDKLNPPEASRGYVLGSHGVGPAPKAMPMAEVFMHSYTRY